MIGQSMMKFFNIMKNCWAFIQLIGLQHIITKQVPDLIQSIIFIDAFNASWKEENNWLVPPPNLIAKVINDGIC